MKTSHLPGRMPNRMKEKIARGEPALGCSVMFPSPQIVEMLGFAGTDVHEGVNAIVEKRPPRF
mgnify:CR=1 FL=1